MLQAYLACKLSYSFLNSKDLYEVQNEDQRPIVSYIFYRNLKGLGRLALAEG